MKNALIVWGGWDGHQPKAMADLLGGWLREEGFLVEVSSELARLSAGLDRVDLIVPCWTMGAIDPVALKAVTDAVAAGTGIAGVHGGMGDSFREATEWQFMVGGQFVAHPGNMVSYTVEIRDLDHPVTAGLPSFEVVTEQYYMHIDPAVHVLASTRFPVATGPHVANGVVDVPVAWTKRYGAGRVFYCSLGHEPADITSGPAAELVRRGLVWASR